MVRLLYKIGNQLNTSGVLFNKLNDYFKHNIRLSLIFREIFIITEKDLFYCIDFENENIPSFIINDDKLIIESMKINDLCNKQINDLHIFDRNSGPNHCFARNDNETKIYYYYYDIEYGVMKEDISEEKVVDICYGYRHSILQTQSGNVYQYLMKDYERENSEKYIH